MPISPFGIPQSQVTKSPLTGQRREFMPKFSPEQQQALSQLLQTSMGGLQQGMDFAPIEQAARTQFQEKTIPGIAERFTQFGGQRSSAFQQALGQAGSGLEENLAQLKLQHQQGQQGFLQNLLNMALQPQFETFEQQQQPGFLESFLPQLGESSAQLLPQLLQMYLQKHMEQPGGADEDSFLRNIQFPEGGQGGLQQTQFGQQQGGGRSNLAMILKSLMPAIGAGVGSLVPGVGTTVGGLVGGGLQSLF